MEYLPRVLDGRLNRLLEDVPAVAVVGPKAVGKTETSRRRAKAVIDLGDEFELDLVKGDPERLNEGPYPLLIDEWQLHPPVWDRVRRAVDRGVAPGTFIMTGSATPAKRPMHSGAGRIVQVRMRPLSLVERGLTAPTVSLAALLTGERGRIRGESPVVLSDYVDEIVASGLPGVRTVAQRSRDDLLDGYLDAVVERDFPEAGHNVRRPRTLRAWLRAFAAASATTADYASITDAATAGEADKPARSTTLSYRETLERMWLVEEVPAWTGIGSMLKALATTPKHHLCDPALAARLLNVDATALLHKPNPTDVPLPRSTPLVGALFESLVTLCVQVYADANGARVSHFRTKKGDREIDLIVERPDGRVVAIEVKLAARPDNGDLKHLKWLRDQIGDDLLDAAVVTTGPVAFRREDGIAVIPAALLGP